ncbi:MAG: AAA family ATPase [Terriglobia bacterium]
MFLEFYGLREQPFGVTPDPRFLYFGESHREVWASLTYGIETGRGFMALIAYPGMGKTTLLFRLMDQFRGSARSAFLFQQQADSRSFMRSLLVDLGLTPGNEDLVELQKQLNDVLLDEFRQGRRFLLILDEAQNFDDSILETIRMLSNFETPSSKLIQIIMAGQPQLADKLVRWELVQLRQRISVLTHLEPFDTAEVDRYIAHRLETAGYNGPGIFTPGAIEEIARRSGGIPRNINDLCFHALSLGYAQSQEVIDDPIIQEAARDLNLAVLGARGYAGPAQISAATTRRKASPPPASGTGRRRSAIPVGSVPLRTARGHVPAWFGGTRRPAIVPRWLVGAVVVLGAFLLADSLFTGRDVAKDLSAEQSLGSVGRQVDRLLGRTPKAIASPATFPTLNPVNVPKPTPNDLQATEPEPANNDAESDVSTEAIPDAPSTGEDKARQELEKQVVSPSAAPASEKSRDGNREAADSAPSLPKAVKKAKGGGARQSLESTLLVNSDLAGAKIYLNGANQSEWTTPYLFSLPPGTYRVSLLKPGFQPTTDWITLRARERRKVNLRILARNDTPGGITVKTEPAGLLVFIDGKSYGHSEVTAQLNPGEHILRVVPPPGMAPYAGTFRLQPGLLLKKTIRWPNGASAKETNEANVSSNRPS